tara:strand:+ start:711 stop:1286 length:576 start_codon:yes stop_codon:yes gene_type:complete
MLKKEFKRRDVERMRNLIKGDVGSSSETQIGYNKKRIEYKEGDIWTEGRKTWTIKNGIKKTVSKLSSIRKEIFTPLCCPKCSKVIKHPLDKSNYKVHKKCHDCVIEFEHKLRIKGKYDDYIKKLKTKNALDIINETEAYLLDMVNTSNEGYVSEDGVVEKWVGGINKKEFTKKIKDITKARKEYVEKESNG